MSAIAGRWNFDGNPHASASCERMLAAQRIYGPDDERRWSNGSIAMGRCLYRTLPEDALDRQPLHSVDGRLTLVADVRLDNRDELASELGIPSSSAAKLCDAAIVLAALERWDEQALDRLVGDFAFALWNSRDCRLLLARDFLGQRPLHYHRGRDFVAFATMPKGLHALPEVPYAPDEQVMAEFVALLPDGGSRSFFKDIATVPPGHCVTVTAEGISAQAYWTPTRKSLARPRGEDFIEGLRHHLDMATTSRLRGANGRVGAHLSGGFDSAAVTATAARLLGQVGGRVTAFTSVPREGYDGGLPKNRIGDEGPLAAQTAAQYDNIEHVLIRTGHVSPLEAVDRNFYLYDRPMLNLCNGTWLAGICQAAKERGLGVVLTGQMGNMTISYAGTERLAELLRTGHLVALAQLASATVRQKTMRWGGVFAQTVGPYLPPALWRQVAKRAGHTFDLSHYTAIRQERLTEMNLGELARERKLDFSYRPRKDGFDTRLWVLQRSNPGNTNKGILAGYGVDQRDPTADKRLVEYCLGVPMEAWFSAGETRALGKRALADRLPGAVLYEPRKGYQAVDWHEGLTAAKGEVEAEVARITQCAPATDTLDVARLQRLVADWPTSGWSETSTMQAYRLALLRGLSAGHFLRKVTGANQ